jgi:hypothetical protein
VLVAGVAELDDDVVDGGGEVGALDDGLEKPVLVGRPVGLADEDDAVRARSLRQC